MRSDDSNWEMEQQKARGAARLAADPAGALQCFRRALVTYRRNVETKVPRRRRNLGCATSDVSAACWPEVFGAVPSFLNFS